MQNPEKILPRNTYNEGAKLTQEEKYALDRCLDWNSSSIDKTLGIKELDVRAYRRVNNIMDNHLRWIQNFLGLSAGLRGPDLNKIFILNKETFLKQAPNKNFTGWFSYPSREIFVLDDPQNNKAAFQRISHELVHMFARNSMIITKISPGNLRIDYPHLGGYNNPRTNSLTLLNEALTETINIEALDFLRKQNPEKDCLTNITIGYLPAVIFIDAAIQKIAEKTGQTHEQVRKSLYTGYFEGKTSVIKIFNQVFGNDTLKLISKIPPAGVSGAFKLLILSDHIGLNTEELRKKVASYTAGEEITLYSGIKLRGPKP